MVLVLVCGFSFAVVYANLFVLNYANSSVSVEEGMTIYKYQDELEQVLEDKVDFDGEVYSSGQFEVGKDDLVAVDDTDDYLTLNHYGDNAPETSLADWWDDDGSSATKYNWRYRRCYTVDNTLAGSSSVSEYQVLFEFDSESLIADGKLDADGDDLRFVDESGNVLDYWVVYGMGTDNTQVWVQLDGITSGETEEVCMYYGYVGSGSASSLSDAESVFTYSSQKALYYSVAANATGTNAAIGSYVSGTGSNQVNYGAYSNNFDQYEVVDNISIPTPGTPILAEGALMVSFENDAADAAVPIGYAGTLFVADAARYTDEFSIVAPYGSALVDISEASGGSFIPICSNLSVLAGSFGTFTCDITNGSTYKIESDVPILVTHGTTGDEDAYHLYPVDKAYQTMTGKYELWGVGADEVHIASDGVCLGVEVYRSNNATPLTVDLNAANNFSTFVDGGGTQGQSIRYRIVSDCPIGAFAISDGDGVDGVVFLPPREFSHEFLVTQNTQYISGVAPSQNLSCRLYNTLGNLVGTDTSTNGDGSTRPSEVYFPTNNSTLNAIRYFDEYRVECDEPIYAYYENYDALQILLTLTVFTDDQTSFLSWPQGRQRVAVEPVLEDYFSTQEEGLYYESGFGDGEGSVVELEPILWVDASDINGDGSSFSDGTFVDEWFDKSYRNNDLTSVVGRGVPLKQTDGGREVVEFTTDSLQSINNLFASYPATDATWFMVSRTRAITDGYAFVTDSNAVSDRFGTHLPYGDGIWHSDFDCCTDGRISVAWGGNTSDYFLWNGRHSSTTGKELRRNTATVASSVVNTTGSNSQVPINVGSSDTDTNHQEINIAELIIFDKDLESDEVIAVENYLRDKWGVATAGLEVDPKGYMDWIVDGTGFSNPDHIYWDRIEWEEVVSDRTGENFTDGVLVEVAYADAVPSCAAATYSDVQMFETEISSVLDTSPLYSDETIYRKYIKLLDSMSDHQCLKVRVYLQTGDEAYAPRLNNIKVVYKEAELLEDQLNSPAIDVAGNDGTEYGNARTRVLKVLNGNTGLDNSTCELFYGGGSNTAVFSDANFSFVDVGDGNILEETLQFDFPIFPAAPPEIGSGNSIECDSNNELALYFEHVRSAGGLENFDLALKQDIGGLMGPLNERGFNLRVASP